MLRIRCSPTLSTPQLKFDYRKSYREMQNQDDLLNAFAKGLELFADIGLWILAAVLVAAGIAGTVFPALPGVALVFLGLLIAAWVDDFERVTWIALLVLGLLTLLSFVVDFLATVLGVQRVGASRAAIIGALAGTIIGMFFGFLGLIFGPFAGAVMGELYAHGRMGQASRVGIATWIGLVFGTLAKIGLVFTMLGVFAAAYFL